MSNILELYDLYGESLVRETIEKTKSCGLVWSSLGGNQFQATQIDESVDPTITWDFFITRSQVGNVSFTYTFDVKKDSVAWVSTTDGPLTHTSRDSQVKNLYEIVEIIVLQLDTKLKQSLQFVQGITDCRS